MFRKLLVIRHGESVGNQCHIIQGRLDKYGLTEKGRHQISELEHIIADFSPTIILASPQKRAIETTGIIKELLGNEIPVFIEPLLQEVDHGLLDGMSKSQCKEAYADKIKILKESNYDYSIFQGESLEAVRNRARCLKDKIMYMGGQSILIVTHGGFMRSFFSLFANNSENTYQCENGCAYLIEPDLRGYRVNKLKPNM